MFKKIAIWYQQKQLEKNMFKEYLKNKKYYEQFCEYINYKTHLPALHSVKQNNIHAYRKAYNLNVFIETGTYLGDMIAAQQQHFKSLYSIELSQELYLKAIERFKDVQNVHLFEGDSGIVLGDVLKEINEPVLFWLDGHYSSGITAKGDENTPILKELKLILASNYEHIILIDDARLFVGKDDYPSLDEIVYFISKYGYKKRVEVADDIIRLLPIPK